MTEHNPPPGSSPYNESHDDRQIARAFDRLNEDTRETVLPSRSLARLQKQSRPWVRAMAPALSAAAALIIAIGIFGLFRAGTDSTLDAADDPTTTTTVAPTTTVPDATTTVPPTTDPPPTSELPNAAPETYRVVNVDANDALNVRADPDIDSPIIAVFPPDATGIRTTGETAGPWLLVFTLDGRLGWSHTDFLALESAPGSGYQVRGVAPDDTLAVRSAPGASNPKVGDLAHDATDVELTGRASGGTEPWWEVRLPDGTLGWSASRFLHVPAGWDASFGEEPCSGLRSSYTTDATSTGPQESAADAVLGVGHSVDPSGTCARTVITLGTAVGPTADGWVGAVADTVPGGVTVGVDGQVVTVHLPGIIDARPVAVTTTNELGRAYVVRAADGNMTVVIHAAEPVLIRAAFLGDPARIVVDTIPAGTPGEEFFDGGTVVLVTPSMPGDGGPVVVTGTTLSVAGYSRPFESTGAAQLLEAATEQGSGDRVIVQWETAAGKVANSQISFATTDAVSAWGFFEFTITDLRPGSYELFVGEFSANDGAPVGLYVPIEVTP